MKNTNKTIIITVLGIIALLLIAGCSKSTPNVITGEQQTGETPTDNTQTTTEEALPDTDTEFFSEETEIDIGESV